MASNSVDPRSSLDTRLTVLSSRTSYQDRAKYIANTGFFPETLEVRLRVRLRPERCVCFQIHWLSVINSMVLVFLLIGFVIIILVSGVPG